MNIGSIAVSTETLIARILSKYTLGKEIIAESDLSYAALYANRIALQKEAIKRQLEELRKDSIENGQ